MPIPILLNKENLLNMTCHATKQTKKKVESLSLLVNGSNSVVDELNVL